MIRIYEITKQNLEKVKKVLEAPDEQIEEGKWQINEFKRIGYLLRDAKALGLEEYKDMSYLYIKAAEDFFERNEKLVFDAGAEALKNEKLEKVRDKIEETEAEAAAGVGAIFK